MTQSFNFLGCLNIGCLSLSQCQYSCCLKQLPENQWKINEKNDKLKAVIYHLVMAKRTTLDLIDNILQCRQTTDNRHVDVFTAVSIKVVQKKRKSVRDNAERWSGKYPINFNKSSESIFPPSQVFAVRSSNMDSELSLKFIGYFPDYLSALSRTLLSFFPDNL